ncbi:MFS transporter [Labedaea rhizosphaerae]|uniref:MFS transporter n=1 Tax=Labedaea rhizosphaerae TaxID=598644 RepID=A0A4R6SJD0_LABRH|nr:MFS transporter [Labedaea rhizosphaerae]TDQ01039.1 hypothetical protein EV186_102906 [Labedaea rhizosphaerae]
MGAKTRLVGAAGVSQVGNWLTFTGLLQYLQNTFGSSATIGAFLVQAAPPLLLARWATARMAGFRTRFAWLAVQLPLAALSLALLARGWGLVYVLCLLGVTSLFRTIGNTLFMSVATDWTPEGRRSSTFTAIGSVGSITLAISPAFGGVIGGVLGFSALFVIDAVTFVVAALVLARAPREAPDGRIATGGPTRLVGRPRGVAGRFVPGLRLWVWFGVVGAAVNAVELPVFADVHHFGVTGFGVALTCYGTGGLVAFLLSLVRKDLAVRLDVLALIYAVALAAWVYAGHAGAFAGFAVAGLTYGLYSGRLRARVAGAAEDEVSTTDIWAWANQTTQLVNLIVYATGALLFAAGVPVLACAALTLACAVVVVVLSYTARRKDTPVDLASGPRPTRCR